MKKVFYSAIVILYSLFTIVLIINYGYKEKDIDESVKYKAVNEETAESEENAEAEENLDLTQEDNTNDEAYKQKRDADDNNEKNRYGSTNSKGEKGKSAEIIDRGENDLPYSGGAENSANIAVKEPEEEKDAPILKIPAKEIPAKMSLNDKMILLSYSKKLKREDYEKIINYIKNYNPRNAIKNTFYILDDRLSDEEIEEIKKILSKYINFSNV